MQYYYSFFSHASATKVVPCAFGEKDGMPVVAAAPPHEQSSTLFWGSSTNFHKFSMYTSALAVSGGRPRTKTKRGHTSQEERNCHVFVDY